MSAAHGDDNNNGQCWEEACATFEKALGDLNNPQLTITEIRLAAGNWKPSSVNGSFVIERQGAMV